MERQESNILTQSVLFGRMSVFAHSIACLTAFPLFSGT